MAFALQWSLDNTTSSGLSLSRGLIAAATSDNVEPLAVVACEKFGATLSICRDSCAKTERLVEPQKPVIRFLGAYIGYSANDCATQLVKSVAGVQFLALAGPLVSSIELMTGANALEVLLERSAGDKTQSQDSTNSKTFWKNATRVPDAHAIAELVLGLSKLKVLGPSSRLEIKAGHEIPWVVAFTRWFLGTCPSITFECGEILLRSSSEFRVTIIALEGHNMPLEITFPTDLGRPSDLIDGNVSDNRWSGMVSVKAYGQFLRDEFDMSSEDDIRRLEIFLPYAVSQALTLLRPSKDTINPLVNFSQHTGQYKPPNYTYSALHGSLSTLVANPFGKDFNISKAISLILGHSSDEPLNALSLLQDDEPFHELPTLQSHLMKLKETCECGRCRPRTTECYLQCRSETFWSGIVALVMDILCLSLFENIDELVVSLHQNTDIRCKISSGVFDLLTQGSHQSYNVLEFYTWALRLVGYSEMDNECTDLTKCILSSAKGQVTYLKLFQTRQISRRGYLTLAWAHGLVRFKDQQYPAVVASGRSSPILGQTTAPQSRERVKRPLNLYTAYSMKWDFIPKPGCLELRAICRKSGLVVTEDSVINPFTILEILLSLLSWKHANMALIPLSMNEIQEPYLPHRFSVFLFTY